jgi:hypothetical protein
MIFSSIAGVRLASSGFPTNQGIETSHANPNRLNQQYQTPPAFSPFKGSVRWTDPKPRLVVNFWTWLSSKLLWQRMTTLPLHIKWIEIHLPVCVDVAAHIGLASGITRGAETAKTDALGCPCSSFNQAPAVMMALGLNCPAKITLRGLLFSWQ